MDNLKIIDNIYAVQKLIRNEQERRHIKFFCLFRIFFLNKHEEKAEFWADRIDDFNTNDNILKAEKIILKMSLEELKILLKNLNKR